MILETYKPIVEKAEKQLLTGLDNCERNEVKAVYNELLKFQVEYYAQYLKFYSEVLNADPYKSR